MIISLLLSTLFNWCERNVLLCVAELLHCSSSWMMLQMKLKRWRLLEDDRPIWSVPVNCFALVIFCIIFTLSIGALTIFICYVSSLLSVFWPCVDEVCYSFIPHLQTDIYGSLQMGSTHCSTFLATGM